MLRFSLKKCTNDTSQHPRRPEHPLVILRLLLKLQRIGAARRRHTPYLKPSGTAHPLAHLRKLSARQSGHHTRSLLPRSHNRMAQRHLRKKLIERHSLHNLQKLIRRIAHQPAHLPPRIIQRNTPLLKQTLYSAEIEPLRARVIQSITVAPENQPHHKPEIIRPVRIIKIHRPPLALRRKRTHNQHPAPWPPCNPLAQQPNIPSRIAAMSCGAALTIIGPCKRAIGARSTGTRITI